MDDRYFENCVGIPLGLAADLGNPNLKPTYDPNKPMVDILSLTPVLSAEELSYRVQLAKKGSDKAPF